MLKKGLGKLKGANKKLSIAMMAFALMILAALPASASSTTPQTLTDATELLTDGAADMKTNAFVIIGVVIGILVVVFGISWLITIFKKKMSKAS